MHASTFSCSKSEVTSPAAALLFSADDNWKTAFALGYMGQGTMGEVSGSLSAHHPSEGWVTDTLSEHAVPPAPLCVAQVPTLCAGLVCIN